MWQERIPKINLVFFVLYIAFVFIVNIFILRSIPGFLPFWYVMAGSFALVSVFFLFEWFALPKWFVGPTSKIDIALASIIVLRNVVVLLISIPVVNVVGIAVGYYFGWLIIAVYIALFFVRMFRHAHTHKV